MATKRAQTRIGQEPKRYPAAGHEMQRSSGAAHVDNRSSTAAQRQLAQAIGHSAQTKVPNPLRHYSSAVAAQRRLIENLVNPPGQRPPVQHQGAEAKPATKQRRVVRRQRLPGNNTSNSAPAQLVGGGKPLKVKQLWSAIKKHILDQEIDEDMKQQWRNIFAIFDQGLTAQSEAVDKAAAKVGRRATLANLTAYVQALEQLVQAIDDYMKAVKLLRESFLQHYPQRAGSFTLFEAQLGKMSQDAMHALGYAKLMKAQKELHP